MIYLWFLIPVHAQESPILHYTSDDGLPSNTVYSIYRDSKGFLWMATDKGAARYNGSKFEIFTTFNGLPDNEIFFFEEDPQQRLWLSCYNGALCYLQNDTFFTAANKSFLKLPIKVPYMQHLEVESDSSLTISFANGTKFINIRQEHITYMDLEHIAPEVANVHCVFKKKISDNLYRIIYPNITFLIDTNSHVQKITRDTFHADRFTSCQKQTYILGKRNFFSIDLQPIKALPEMATKNNNIIEIYADGKNVFYATSNGLIINDSVRLFEGQKVSSVTKDAYGNYWVSTLGNGIYCLGNTLFNVALHKNVYRGNVVYATTMGKHIFFATDQKELFHMFHNRITKIVSKEQLNQAGILGQNESAFYIDSNYRYYHFCDNNIVGIKNLLSGSIRVHIQSINSIGMGFKALFLSGNILYARKYNHIIMLPKDTRRRLGVVIRPNTDLIFGMAQDDHSNIWYSTISALYKIEGNTSIEQHQYKNIAFKNFEFSSGYVIGINHNNNLVIGNMISGKIVLDTIPSQNCIWEKIHKIDSNHVIVKTSNFFTILTLFRSENKPRYSVHILENSFIPLQAESIVSCDHTVYFFNNGSITSIDIDKLFYRPEPPKLFFTKIQANKKTYPISSMVTLPFNESEILKISFSSLSFSKVRLFWQYAISKQGQYTWTDINAGELNLANPGYGDYVIMIRAKTLSSSYSSPITFTLRVLRPFWASWWFIALASCMVIGLLFVLVIFTKRTAEKATQRKNLQMELELKAIYAQINPHFIFNTLNSALLLVRKKRFEDAYTHISQFSRLLRNYITSSRNKLITIADEIINLKDYLELQKTRFANKFEYAIFVEPTIDPYVVKIPSLLLQPFVENALNHGLLPRRAAGHLKIEFVIGAFNDEIICKIDDDGIGRGAPSAKKDDMGKSDSYGNLLIRDLVNIFNKYEQMNITIQYIDKKEPLTGTTVLISIKQPHHV